MNEPFRAIDQVTSTAIDLGMKFGPRLVVAIVILVAGWLAGRWAARVTLRMVARFHLDPPVLGLLERLVRIVVLALFGIVALQNLGVELLPLIAGLGVAGAGVAIAMQGVLGNIVAGLTIIFTRPYRVGDFISIAKEEGAVLEITVFNTVLGHPDLSRVVIPNRKIVGEILHNYGAIRQLGLEVGVGGGSDVGAVLAAIEEVLRANPRAIRDPAPVVKVNRLADGGIVVGVNPWVAVGDYVAAAGEINRSIVEEFRRRGIVPAVPQREVRLLGEPPARLA